MPVDWSRYPANWDEVVARIRERSGNKCEWCGLANGALGYRDKAGGWHPLDGSFAQEVDAEAEGWRPCKIVLTTAHLGTPHADGRPADKHDKMDVRDENLAHLCQRCHLNYDRDEHMANARKTRNRKKGQVDIFDEGADAEIRSVPELREAEAQQRPAEEGLRGVLGEALPPRGANPARTYTLRFDPPLRAAIVVTHTGCSEQPFRIAPPEGDALPAGEGRGADEQASEPPARPHAAPLLHPDGPGPGLGGEGGGGPGREGEELPRGQEDRPAGP